MKRKIIFGLLCLGLAAALAGCSSVLATEPAEKLGKLESFSATTLDGSTFTEKDLAAKDMTLINFWTTQCGPCIEEMPDLAAFEKKLPDNVQMITICLMASNDAENVRRILDKAGFEGTTLLDGDGDFAALCKNVQATPTTVLVDSSGKLVGKSIVGAPDNMDKTFLKAINKALEEAGKTKIQLKE